MNLILFGFKNCGKTTFGKLLAKHLKRSFIDTDRLLEQIFYEQTHQSLSCREIFLAVGAASFRKLESNVLEQLTTVTNTIIALGGGFILTPSHVSALAKLGQLVYLKLSKRTLKKRTLAQLELPAYLDPLDPEGSFEKMYEERREAYEEIDAISLDMESKTQDEILLELSALIENSEHLHGK